MSQIVFRNKKIFYQTEGKGAPVILLHGFAETGHIWKYQLEKLREDFCVIIPDLPGSGASEMLEGETSIDDYAEVIKAIADTERNNGENNLFTIIGHSMGGYITLAFAEKYPELLNAFGLFHSSAYADDDAKIETRRKGIEFIRNNGASSFLKTAIPNLFSEETKKQNPEFLEELIEDTKDFDPGALIQYYQAMIKRPDRTPVLKTFQKPILFIAGESDKAVPLQLSLKQCHLPSITYVHFLKKSGHMGMWEEKEKANENIMRFLKR